MWSLKRFEIERNIIVRLKIVNSNETLAGINFHGPSPLGEGVGGEAKKSFIYNLNLK